MTALDKAPTRLNSIVQGQYLLTDVTQRQTSGGKWFATATLEDSTDSIDAYVWPESGLLGDLPVHRPVPVQAALYVRRFAGRVIGDLRALHTISEPEIRNAARLLPRSLCPEAAVPALEALETMVGKLDPEPLCRFINGVLLDTRISPAILTCRGSLGHHHATRGGLLSHSMHVVALCDRLTEGTLTPVERDLIKVVALLHDIGKIRTVGDTNTRPVHYKLVDHGMQTSRLLDKHLEWLRPRAPDLAAALNYMLSYIAQPSAVRGRARYIGADIVIYADRISAGLANGRRLSSLLGETLAGQQLAALPVLAHQTLVSEQPALPH